MIVIDLPIPPSVNAATINVDKKKRGKSNRSRVKSPVYRAWIDEAGWKLLLQRPQRVTGPVSLQYLVEDAGQFDLGNIEKQCTDLLVTHRIIEGDRRKTVREINLKWTAGVVGVRVIIKSAGEKQDGMVEHGELGMDGRSQGRKAEKALG